VKNTFVETGKLAGVLSLLMGTAAFSDTITLQQGSGGYAGCSDSYISRHYANTAQSVTKATLELACDNYQWNPGW